MDLKDLERAIKHVETAKAPGEEELDLVLEAAKLFASGKSISILGISEPCDMSASRMSNSKIYSLPKDFWDHFWGDSWGD